MDYLRYPFSVYLKLQRDWEEKKKKEKEFMDIDNSVEIEGREGWTKQEEDMGG